MLKAPLLVCGSGGLGQRRLSETIDLCGLRDFECAWVIGDTLSQNRVLYEQSKSAGASGYRPSSAKEEMLFVRP